MSAVIVPIVLHIVVHGRVQGVGYRAFVEREAGKRQLAGWVRNCRDGTVEALFRGEVAVVRDMIVTCRRGPFAARVDALHERDGAETDLKARLPGQTFSVLPTF